MATTATRPEEQLEDPLAYLPCSRIVEYGKGKVIYSAEQPHSNLNLIVEGKVKVLRVAGDGQEVVLDIYRTDEFFGESSLLGQAPVEQAVALEHTRLMTWSMPEIADIIARSPRLGIALLQVLVQRSLDLRNRLESFCVDNIARRLARSLIRYSQRLGDRQEDGSVQMMPFTHELLSQVVGTSREIVTHHMSNFRREGYLRYSRKGIALYDDALRDWLRQPAS